MVSAQKIQFLAIGTGQIVLILLVIIIILVYMRVNRDKN